MLSSTKQPGSRSRANPIRLIHRAAATRGRLLRRVEETEEEEEEEKEEEEEEDGVLQKPSTERLA